MKKILVFGILSVFLFFIAAAASAKTYTGYAADNLCWSAKGHVAADGADLSKNPEKHTVMCLKNPPCAASGYGLLMKGSDGSYSFTKFDAKGNKMMAALLKATKRANGYYVQVKGVMVKNMMKVSDIKEAEPETAMK